MPDTSLMPALRDALRRHEIGNRSPYRLSYAGQGRSGGSFGCLQGDLANGPTIVRQTLRGVLAASGVSDAEIEVLMARLVRRVPGNAPDSEAARLVDAALDAPAGRRLVDAMDIALLAALAGEVDRCLAVAAESGRRIEPQAQIMIALWINMSGRPTTLLHWLAGRPVTMGRPVAAPGRVVDVAAVRDYLAATAHFIAHPRNLAHLLRSASVVHPEPIG